MEIKVVIVTAVNTVAKRHCESDERAFLFAERLPTNIFSASVKTRLDYPTVTNRSTAFLSTQIGLVLGV